MSKPAVTAVVTAAVPVNVASVPQLSLFRYPGGKSWLAPQLRAWMASLPQRPNRFVDLFTGGGSMGLLAAVEGLAGEVVMVELDPGVAAVWRTVVSGLGGELAERIETFKMDSENVQAVLSDPDMSTAALAFRTVVRNRVARGGILAPGAGVLKAGEGNRGLGSRWYPETLARRIRNVSEFQHHLTFIEGDAFEVFEGLVDDPDTVWFVDPPYTAGGKKAGSRLYLHSEVDHDRLFGLLSAAAGDILATYDNVPEVRALADRHHLSYRPVAMRNTHHAAMEELLIGRNLNWVL